MAAAAASAAVWVCFFEFEALVFGKKGGGSVLRDEGLRKISVAVGTQFVHLEEGRVSGFACECVSKFEAEWRDANEPIEEEMSAQSGTNHDKANHIK